MATLGEIRKRSGLLLAVIGFAMLAFILTDFMNSLGSGNRGSIYAGEILGKDILIQEYENKVEEGINNWKSQNQQAVLSQSVRGQIRQQMWDQYVREVIMNNEYKKIGISVSDDEFFELLQGVNVHPQISQVPAFQDPNSGQFDRSKVISYLKQIDQDQTGEARSRWLNFQKYLIGLIETSKYNTLIEKSMYTTNKQARDSHNQKFQTSVFNYIAINYNSVNDSLVTPSMKDIKKYYNKNKNNYEQEASNDVDFVVFNVSPSAEDDAATLQSLEELRSDFALYDDYELMVKRNSDSRSSTYRYLTKNEMQDPIHIASFDEIEGKIIGPYKTENGIYRLSKIVSSQNRPDSVQARHILLKPTDKMSLDSIYIRLELLKLQIEKGEDFGEIAQNISEDRSSAIKGGELGWFREGVMVESFNNICFTSKIGVLNIVESQFGIHLIEVTKKSKLVKKLKIASIDRFVEPSSETFNNYYSQAAQFTGKILNEGISFDSLVNRENLIKRSDNKVTINKQSIAGVPNSRELVRWMNNAEVGSISEVFQFDNTFVVAYLKNKNLQGFTDLDEIKEEISSLVLNEKKGDYIINMTKDKNITTVAEEQNLSLVQGAVANMNDLTVQAIGYEPDLVGAVFGTDMLETSSPIRGKNAVYIIEVVSKDEYVTTNNTNQIKKDLNKADFLNAQGAYYSALKDAAEVIDNRSEFY